MKQFARKIQAVFTASLLGMLWITQAPHSAEAAVQMRDTGISYEESTETVLNPGMGYTTTLWYRCAPGKTEVKNPAGALVLMFIDIGAFSSGENGTKDADGNYTPGTDYPLDDTFFAGLRGTFENCRRNGSTIALRFRYDDDGTPNPEPATFDLMKQHIQQIADSGLLTDYQDILMYVESGFVGCYGEQWGGKYCSLEQKAELLDLLLDIVPDPIPVTVRTPNIFAKWAGIDVKELGDWISEPGSKAARVGLYDDGYMGSDSDLGTYSNREKETTWLGNQSLTSYFGGEFSGNLEFAQEYDTYLPEHAIPEMYKTHLSYINSNIFNLYQDYTFGAEYDVEGADNRAYYGQNVKKFMRDHLGYRFVIRKAEMPETAEQGGYLPLRFSVENTGFANPIRKQKAEILLEKDGNYIRTELRADSRQWYSCKVTQNTEILKLPGSLEPGEWNVYYKLSVGENPVQQVAARSVRFANPDIWNAGLGANYLGTVTIKENNNPQQKACQTFGETGDCTLYTQNGLQVTDGVVSNPDEVSEARFAAESTSGKLYLYNDEQYLYLTALYDAKADAEVHNIQFQNEENGESYWLYYASNGYIYFNHGEPVGCLQKHSEGMVEFRIPLGEVMGLSLGTTITGVRYFLQDSANEWKLLSDVRTDAYTLTGDFPVYTAKRTAALFEQDSLPLSIVTDAAEPAVYQWYHDGKAIAGATADTYTISKADSQTIGSYTVTVISAGGTVKTIPVCDVTDVFEWMVMGDVDHDGTLKPRDAEMLQQYLLGTRTELPAWANADWDGNGKLNGTDLAIMKRMLFATT
ncbi:MAG TPA: hypothetical protein DCG49_08140 [Ruminococcus sp.]|nr:hypothetical protein [Ruminococcus sp.]